MLPMLCAGVCLLLCLPMMYLLRKRSRKLSIAFKTLGTVMAALPALQGASVNGGAAWWCFAALMLCAAADAALEIRFLTGIILFALGHVCYCIWLAAMAPLGTVHLMVLPALLTLSALLLLRWRKRLGKWFRPFAGYSIMLSLMGALAVGAGFSLGGAAGLLLVSGGLLFVISDILVARSFVHRPPLWLNVAAMGIYYAAQLLLGLSCRII